VTAVACDAGLSTGAIEAAIASHPAVAECACIGPHDDLKGQVPVALVVLKKGVAQTGEQVAAELVKLVRAEVGPIAAFRTAVIVNRLPKTRSGKVLRATMKTMAGASLWGHADSTRIALAPSCDEPVLISSLCFCLYSVLTFWPLSVACCACRWSAFQDARDHRRRVGAAGDRGGAEGCRVLQAHPRGQDVMATTRFACCRGRGVAVGQQPAPALPCCLASPSQPAVSTTWQLASHSHHLSCAAASSAYYRHPGAAGSASLTAPSVRYLAALLLPAHTQSPSPTNTAKCTVTMSSRLYFYLSVGRSD